MQSARTRPALVEIPRLRMGSVAYLNSVPLTYGWENAFSFEHPAILAEGLGRLNALDGGLAPLAALFDPGRYVLADGVGICAEGPVYSVGVVAAQPLEDLAELCLTDASRSSRALLKLLYAEFMPRALTKFSELHLPEHHEAAWETQITETLESLAGRQRGLLLIGDRALAAHRLVGEGQTELRFYDLAELWGKFTGLPFVFAMWGLRTSLPGNQLQAVSDELRALAEYGLAHREEIAAQARADGLMTPTEVLDYLTHKIRYRVGEREKQGIAEYLRLMKKHELLPAGAGLPEFV